MDFLEILGLIVFYGIAFYILSLAFLNAFPPPDTDEESDEDLPFW